VEPQFDHQKKLKVYQASLEFVTWATDLLSKLEPKAAVRDQLHRASISVPLNIAEGNRKSAVRDLADFSILLVVRRKLKSKSKRTKLP
jgi:hypothetical protein